MTTIILLAGGPSLTRADVALCEQAGHPLLGINNAYLLTDKLSIHYACDTTWWQWAYSEGDGAPPYPPQPHTDKYSIDHGSRPKRNEPDPGYPGVTQMKMGEREGLSHTWPYLSWGGNSGYQAINLVCLLGYKRILLLGYDMQEKNGQAHWHPDHQFRGSRNPSKGTFTGWLRDFRTLAKAVEETGIKVINCTRETALTCFPQARLEDAL